MFWAKTKKETKTSQSQTVQLLRFFTNKKKKKRKTTIRVLVRKIFMIEIKMPKSHTWKTKTKDVKWLTLSKSFSKFYFVIRQKIQIVTKLVAISMKSK